MKDAIDKRNERERIARSIVKRYNVIYTSREELERRAQEEKHQQMQEERAAAEEVVKKLKDEENKKMAMEIQRLLAEREMLERQLETGMDATGRNPMSGVTQERVEAILSEKSKQLQELIAAHTMDSRKESQAVGETLPQDDGADNARAEAAGEEMALPSEEEGI